MSITMTYVLGNSLYVNMTNRCSCACDFCLRNDGPGVGSADDLWLDREPSKEALLEDILKHRLEDYAELVFCGYGEPTYRLFDMLWISERVKERLNIKTRLNTNGHASLINDVDAPPLFKGLIDVVSISLNYKNAELYIEHCKPADGEKAYHAMLDFARDIVKYVPEVIMTVVGRHPEEDLAECRRIAESLGARFRVRELG